MQKKNIFDFGHFWRFLKALDLMFFQKNIIFYFFAFLDSLWLTDEFPRVFFFSWPLKGAENDRQSSKFGSKNGHFEGEGGVQKNVRYIFSPFHVISENR